MRCTVKARAFSHTATLSLRTGRPPQPLGFRIWHQVLAFSRNRVAICELYARGFQSFFLKGSLSVTTLAACGSAAASLASLCSRTRGAALLHL
jgi:hypothetical protein